MDSIGGTAVEQVLRHPAGIHQQVVGTAADPPVAGTATDPLSTDTAAQPFSAEIHNSVTLISSLRTRS